MFFLMKLLTFAMIVYGVLRGFQISLSDFKDSISVLFTPKQENIKKQIEFAKGTKKRKGFRLLIEETQSLLKLLNKTSEFPLVCFTSFILGIISIVFSISTNNLFMIIPLFVISAVAPFVYIRHRSMNYKKIINEELETALSIITNSYMRNDNIVTAVEENIAYIHQPIQDVFKSFIFNCDYVEPDVKRNLRTLKNSLHNEVFAEWCNSLIACQSDRNLKFTLNATVKKLSNIRLVSVRLDSMLMQPVKEYVTLILILLLNLPIFYVLNKEWYRILTKTTPGHIILSVCAGIIAITAIGVSRLTRPIEYRR